MANSSLQLHPDLLYFAPDQIQDGTIEYVSFSPNSGEIFGPGGNPTFSLRSSNEFLVLEKSYMTFNVNQVIGGGDSPALGTLSKLGASVFFQSVSDTLSGKQLPSENVSLMKLADLITDTTERKAFTAVGEYFNTSTTMVNKSVIMPVITTLSSANKVIPLCALTGGWNISYQLASFADCFSTTTGTNPTYTISNVRIIGAMLKPTDSYLASLSNSLDSGASLKIPLVLRRDSGQISLCAGTQQIVRAQPGYCSSMNSISCFLRPLTANTDQFTTVIAPLTKYFINVNSQRYPRNFAINTTNEENLYQLISGYNTSLSSMSPNTDAPFLHYTWKTNPAFGSGIPIRDGTISLDTTWSSDPSANKMNIIIEYDAVLVISKNEVNLYSDLSYVS